MKYKIWNKTDNLVTPIGEVLPPSQVIDRHPVAGLDGIKFIVCDAPISMGVFMEFTQTKEHYQKLGADIIDGMSDQEVLNAITDFEGKPVVTEPTAEERIAAALEFQNILAMPIE